jgi:short-subunit dehydrogenase
MEMSKKYQLAFIVGGSSGIGLAIAKQLAENGTQLCLFARNQETLAQAKLKITASSKNACDIFSVDASQYEDLKLCFENAIRLHGVPDLLINCAGRAIPDYFLNISVSQMQQTFQVNFQTIWNACHIMIPHLKTNGATILNTSSIGGFIGVFGFTDYSAAKYAIIGFSEALSQEMEQYNIKIQLLCPPDTHTPGFENENKSKPIETQRISAAAKIMKPEAVAAECIKKLGTKQFMIIPSFDGKLSWWMKRYFPFLVDRIVRAAIKKA